MAGGVVLRHPGIVDSAIGAAERAIGPSGQVDVARGIGRHAGSIVPSLRSELPYPERLVPRHRRAGEAEVDGAEHRATNAGPKVPLRVRHCIPLLCRTCGATLSAAAARARSQAKKKSIRPLPERPAGAATRPVPPLGVFAEFERAIIVERVKAGIARARTEGKHLGRPRIDGEIEQAIRAALAAGKGMRKVAREIGVGTSVVQRIRAESNVCL